MIAVGRSRVAAGPGRRDFTLVRTGRAGRARAAPGRGAAGTAPPFRERFRERGLFVDRAALVEGAQLLVLAAEVGRRSRPRPSRHLRRGTAPDRRRWPTTLPGRRRPDASPVSSAKIAGTAPVGGSVQCGNGGTSTGRRFRGQLDRRRLHRGRLHLGHVARLDRAPARARRRRSRTHAAGPSAPTSGRSSDGCGRAPSRSSRSSRSAAERGVRLLGAEDAHALSRRDYLIGVLAVVHVVLPGAEPG